MIFVVYFQEVQLLFVQVQKTFAEVAVLKANKRLFLVLASRKNCDKLASLAPNAKSKTQVYIIILIIYL